MYILYSLYMHQWLMGRVTIWATTHPEMSGSIKIFSTVILNHYYIFINIYKYTICLGRQGDYKFT